MLNRRMNIDYLRITACLMVIFLHMSSQFWHDASVMTWEWSVYNLYDSIVRSAVPLFFMISGMLFLRKDDMPSLDVLFKKNILKIFVIYVFWSFFYAIDIAILKDAFNIETIFYYIIHPKYHLWYLPVLISMYFILPLFWIIVKYEDGKYLKYILFMFFMLGIMKSTLDEFVIIDYPINEYLDHFTFALTGYSGYYLCGYALDRYRDNFKKIPTFLLCFGFVFLVVIASFSNLVYARSMVEQTTLFYGNSLFVFLEANIIFLIFLRLPDYKIKEKYVNTILKISKNTLFVYLFHVFVIEKLDLWFNINALIMSPLIAIPLLTIIVFTICQIIASLLAKVPFIRKWLI